MHERLVWGIGEVRVLVTGRSAKGRKWTSISLQERQVGHVPAPTHKEGQIGGNIERAGTAINSSCGWIAALGAATANVVMRVQLLT